jgi:FKBP-type peptidyl-prolyl cis-trans isomerase 2
MADINAIISTVNLQLKVVKASVAKDVKSSLSVGDTVKVSSKKETLIGRITEIKRTKAVVRINESLWNVPLTMIEKLINV